MIFYIDCEFNEYKGELISMALVGQDQSEWYEVLECKNPGEWVKEHVIPFLDKKPISRDAMQDSLRKFLGAYKEAWIVADWPEDIKHFCELLITTPGNRIDTPALVMAIDRDLNSDKSAVPHNALEDAKALMRCAYLIDTGLAKTEGET